MICPFPASLYQAHCPPPCTLWIELPSFTSPLPLQPSLGMPCPTVIPCWHRSDPCPLHPRSPLPTPSSGSPLAAGAAPMEQSRKGNWDSHCCSLGWAQSGEQLQLSGGGSQTARFSFPVCSSGTALAATSDLGNMVGVGWISHILGQ